MTEVKPIVGYTAGVYDLLHVGHVALFRRAREHCDILRVGVISDEVCWSFKHLRPYVPFEERLEMVASCRYVDEVVPIREEYLLSKVQEFYERPFDVCFTGNDHMDDFWRMEERQLGQLGARIEYLPYTITTSSTKIRRAIEANIDLSERLAGEDARGFCDAEGLSALP